MPDKKKTMVGLGKTVIENNTNTFPIITNLSRKLAFRKYLSVEIKTNRIQNMKFKTNARIKV